MFPYRRQGPKKRNKNNNNPRRMRGPHKVLPNSARDLLPVLQPATKALAQMLAGRTNPSGQLAHAQAVLAQAERLIAERTHNRLNPSEREEFFEQLARLRLTLADAAAEAEVEAAEEQQPKAPPPPPIDQERLRAMALELSAPRDEPERTAAAETAEGGADEEPAGPETGPVEDGRPDAEPPAVAATPPSAANARSGRLQLSPGGSGEPVGGLGGFASSSAPRVRRTRLKPTRTSADVPADPAESARNGHEPASAQPAPADEAAPSAAEPAAANGAGNRPVRARRPKSGGLPEGWVIDEEGFVVPGPR